jgi:hypothetical protein
MCDLGVTLDRPWLQRRIAQVFEELAARGIVFRPHFWVSDDFFTPDGVPGIAIPFYLTHAAPRAARAEPHFEVEGGTPSWFMRILRHEVGHALDNAYELRQRRIARSCSGRPRPVSRALLAAPLQPELRRAPRLVVRAEPSGRGFRRDVRRVAASAARLAARYADWPALKKLEYMDRLMRELAAQAPPCARAASSGRCTASAGRCGSTTRARRSTTGSTIRTSTIRICGACSRTRPSTRRRCRRRAFSRASGSDVRRIVSDWTGVYQYTIDQVLQEMSDRCDELEPAARERRRTGEGRLHGRVDDAHDELPAQRPAHGGAVMKRRVMVLMHHYLVPPEDVSGHDLMTVQWKTEHDVTTTLRDMGHEIRSSA